jgi:flagellar basal body-associated protein FliL
MGERGVHLAILAGVVCLLGQIGCVAHAPAEAPPAAPVAEPAPSYHELETPFDFSLQVGEADVAVSFMLGWCVEASQHANIRRDLSRRRQQLDSACLAILRTEPTDVYTSMAGVERVRAALKQAVARAVERTDVDFQLFWRRIKVQ